MHGVDYIFLLCVVLTTGAAVQGVVFNSFRWHAPRNAADISFREPAPVGTRLPSMAILVPARHEEQVLTETLLKLCQQGYPELKVVAIIGHDDPETLVAAEAAAYLYPETVSIVIDHSWPKSKPKALASALPVVDADIVGVIDAEDDVAAGLCRRVAGEFLADPAIDVVQGGVHLVNLNGPWFAIRNAVEYVLWYSSRLPYQARLGFIPIGGNTCFFRWSAVLAVGGWDREALAEDADIGVRLAAAGAKVAVRYDEDLATREECPTSTSGLVKQRVRWYQGFIQIIRKREWRSLSRRHQLLAMVTLAAPLLQFLSALMLPGVLLFVGLTRSLSVDLVLAAFVPLFVELVALVLEVDALIRLRRAEGGGKVRVRDVFWLVVSIIPYQLMMGLALITAAVREIRGNHSWAKTDHVGSHRKHTEQVIDLRGLERKKVAASAEANEKAYP